MVDHILVGERKPFSDDLGLGQIILNKFKSKPDLVNLVDAYSKKQNTFGEMLEKSVKCAIWLKEQGVKPGDVISVCSNNHLDIYVPCFAALYVGAILNPWDYQMNIYSAEYFLNLTEPKIIFAIKCAAETLKETFEKKHIKNPPKVVAFGEIEGLESLQKIIDNPISSSEIENFQCAKINDLSSTAIILFSSGTTGLPKGVQLSHNRITHHMRLEDVYLTSGIVNLSFSPIFWISGCAQLIHSVLFSAKRIMYAEFDEETTCKLIEEYEVEWFWCGGSGITRLVISEVLLRYKLPSLKYLVTAGASISVNIIEKLKNQLPHVLVSQSYGMTEIGCITGQRENCSPESVGYLLSNVKLKIVDVDTRNSLGPNQVGELCVKSDSEMLGYYKNPEMTRQIYDRDGWLHTGDLGYFDENNEIFIVDRIKDLIKYRGFQVAPTEIQKVLYSHPAVTEAAVVAVPDILDDEHAVALVTKYPSSQVTEEELLNYTAKYLVEHKRLHGLKILKELPHTSIGKIARKELKEMAKEFFLK